LGGRFQNTCGSHHEKRGKSIKKKGGVGISESNGWAGKRGAYSEKKRRTGRESPAKKPCGGAKKKEGGIFQPLSPEGGVKRLNCSVPFNQCERVKMTSWALGFGTKEHHPLDQEWILFAKGNRKKGGRRYMGSFRHVGGPGEEEDLGLVCGQEGERKWAGGGD